MAYTRYSIHAVARKNLQILFDSGPRMCPHCTNPRWPTTAILKDKSRDISTTAWPILTKFCMVTHIYHIGGRTNACLGFGGRPSQFLQGGSQTAIWGNFYTRFSIVSLLFHAQGKVIWETWNSRVHQWLSEYIHSKFGGGRLCSHRETLAKIGMYGSLADCGLNILQQIALPVSVTMVTVTTVWRYPGCRVARSAVFPPN